MTFVILGFISFLVSLIVFVVTFFAAATVGLTPIHAALMMLVAMFGMFQGAFMMGHVE
jgi:hypothetical protein